MVPVVQPPVTWVFVALVGFRPMVKAGPSTVAAGVRLASPTLTSTHLISTP